MPCRSTCTIWRPTSRSTPCVDEPPRHPIAPGHARRLPVFRQCLTTAVAPALPRASQFQAGHHQPFHHARAEIMLRAAMLAAALCGQHHLMHDAQPGKGAIGIGQLDASANRQFWFGPGVAIAAGTRADAVQVGDETVGIRGSFLGIGRVVVAATGKGDVFCVHGVCSVQRRRQRHRNRWRTVRVWKPGNRSKPVDPWVPTRGPPWNADDMEAGAATRGAGWQTFLLSQGLPDPAALFRWQSI